MRLWDPYEFIKNRCYHWRIGSLEIWIQRTAGEWLIASSQLAEKNAKEKTILAKLHKKPETVEWSRFVVASELNTLLFLPALLDRPVVVSSETSVKILPESKALFFVSIPIVLQIYTGIDKKILLTEIPTVVLSNTWFGDPIAGDLCYSLKNNSSSVMDFQKLCLHVEHLRIYRGEKQLWTNIINIINWTEDQLSQVDFSSEIPDFEKGCELLCKERIPVDKSLLKKSFSILKYFTNF
jgi:hypothetical protein